MRIPDVDVERMYRHILLTEGEKHPLHSIEKLEECGDYILAELESYGLRTSVHEFQVDGFSHTFRNIEAKTSDDCTDELLIVSHYDTGRAAPGANDNGSAIAVMLETARVLSESDFPNNIRFISFSLEETNPTMDKNVEELGVAKGVTDKFGRATNWHTAKAMRKFWESYSKFFHEGFSRVESISHAHIEIQNELMPNERDYLTGFHELNSHITSSNWLGQTGVVGSTAWMRDAKKRGITLQGVICMDTVGYRNIEAEKQVMPPGINPEMIKSYGTQKELSVGDFLFVLGDRNSASLTRKFLTQCELDSIRLPYACIQGNFGFEQIAKTMPDILRSDHAPFWRENIPGIFLSDGANFRYPFYHTQADTIDKVDFDFLVQISKAIIYTALA